MEWESESDSFHDGFSRVHESGDDTYVSQSPRHSPFEPAGPLCYSDTFNFFRDVLGCALRHRPQELHNLRAFWSRALFAAFYSGVGFAEMALAFILDTLDLFRDLCLELKQLLWGGGFLICFYSLIMCIASQIKKACVFHHILPAEVADRDWCWWAFDNDPHCRTVLSSHVGRTKPVHIGGDILDLVNVDIRGALLRSYRAHMESFRKYVASGRNKKSCLGEVFAHPCCTKFQLTREWPPCNWMFALPLGSYTAPITQHP